VGWVVHPHPEHSGKDPPQFDRVSHHRTILFYAVPKAARFEKCHSRVMVPALLIGMGYLTSLNSTLQKVFHRLQSSLKGGSLPFRRFCFATDQE
jgi:hypothetical protein